MIPPFAFLQVGAEVEQLAAALGLMVVAIALLVLEVLLVSFGILGVLAGAAAVYAIVLAFGVGPIAGWSFLIAAPIAATAILRWGLRRLKESSWVPQAEISGHSGARSLTDQLGIDVGSRGTLVTHARPGGRASFDGGTCDVQVMGGPLDSGTPVVVKRIDGPMVFVVAAGPDPAASNPIRPASGQE